MSIEGGPEMGASGRAAAFGQSCSLPVNAAGASQEKGDTILTALIVPKAGGVTSTKVNVVRWLKREGDSVEQGESVVELETEKVSYELESPATGILLKIVAGENVEVPVGNALGYVGERGDAVPKS